MLIEASRGGHTSVANLLLRQPRDTSPLDTPSCSPLGSRHSVATETAAPAPANQAGNAPVVSNGSKVVEQPVPPQEQQQIAKKVGKPEAKEQASGHEGQWYASNGGEVVKPGQEQVNDVEGARLPGKSSLKSGGSVDSSDGDTAASRAKRQKMAEAVTDRPQQQQQHSTSQGPVSEHPSAKPQVLGYPTTSARGNTTTGMGPVATGATATAASVPPPGAVGLGPNNLESLAAIAAHFSHMEASASAPGTATNPPQSLPGAFEALAAIASHSLAAEGRSGLGSADLSNLSEFAKFLPTLAALEVQGGLGQSARGLPGAFEALAAFASHTLSAEGRSGADVSNAEFAKLLPTLAAMEVQGGVPYDQQQQDPNVKPVPITDPSTVKRLWDDMLLVKSNPVYVGEDPGISVDTGAPPTAEQYQGERPQRPQQQQQHACGRCTVQTAPTLPKVPRSLPNNSFLLDGNFRIDIPPPEERVPGKNVMHGPLRAIPLPMPAGYSRSVDQEALVTSGEEEEDEEEEEEDDDDEEEDEEEEEDDDDDVDDDEDDDDDLEDGDLEDEESGEKII